MPRAADIALPEHLPDLGSVERETLDFKREAGSKRGAYEYAKDVAALANHLGGTIIVGAVEDRSTATLVRYEPLTQTDARAVRTAHESAVRDLCSPVPQITTEAIPRDGGFVVAVNVRAHPEKLIGVHRTGERDFWTFPLRRATQTVFLMPEQLPMYADPQVRRVLLLLNQVPLGEIVSLRVVRDRDGAGNTGPAILHSIDELRNTVVFKRAPGLNPFPLDAKGSSFPLDLVRTVYRMSGETWQIVIGAF